MVVDSEGSVVDHNELCEALFFRVARVGRFPVAKEQMIGVFFHGGPRGSNGPASQAPQPQSL